MKVKFRPLAPGATTSGVRRRSRSTGSPSTIRCSSHRSGEISKPRQLAEWVLADGLNVRVQIQLHKLFWGAEARGV